MHVTDGFSSNTLWVFGFLHPWRRLQHPSLSGDYGMESNFAIIASRLEGKLCISVLYEPRNRALYLNEKKCLSPHMLWAHYSSFSHGDPECCMSLIASYCGIISGLGNVPLKLSTGLWMFAEGSWDHHCSAISKVISEVINKSGKRSTSWLVMFSKEIVGRRSILVER